MENKKIQIMHHTFYYNSHKNISIRGKNLTPVLGNPTPVFGMKVKQG